MVLYEMLTGFPPWYCKERLGIVNGILHGKLSFPHHMSDAACSLIAGLLTRDPRYRLGSSFMGATEIIEHPFFAQIDWKSLRDKKLHPTFKPARDSEGSNFDPVFTNAKLDVEHFPLPPRLNDEFTEFHFSRTARHNVRTRLTKLHIRTKPNQCELDARRRDAKRALIELALIVQMQSKHVNESTVERETKAMCPSHGFAARTTYFVWRNI
jgi:serine/threonine protein kinase